MRNGFVVGGINTVTFASRHFWRRRGARRAYPSWVCKERATKPEAKRTAARRVALLWAWGVVARRSQPDFWGCSLLAPSPKRKATQRTSPYLCFRPLGCGAAIRLPGLLEGAGWRGGRRRETYDQAEGSSRCSGPVRPFWSSLVKPGQTQSKRKQGFDRQTPAGLRNIVTCQKMT
jgi:hypothetical protein